MMRQNLKRQSDSRDFVMGLCNSMSLFWLGSVFFLSTLLNLLYITWFYKKELRAAATMAAHQHLFKCIKKRTNDDDDNKPTAENNTSLNLVWIFLTRNKILHICKQFLNYVSIKISSSIHSNNYYLTTNQRPSLPQTRTFIQEVAPETNFCLHGSVLQWERTVNIDTKYMEYIG